MSANSAAPANLTCPPGSADRRPISRPAVDREVEDRLDALLADPIVKLLMERDGVERDVILRMAQKVRRQVRDSRHRPAGPRAE